ncbi:MAG: AbrB/MazE/SpoVT family DNA-binding domain-containing protein [Chloroflexi bacterium]|nr:AbrB/MazE/SpoVT family DNA-binding domain-containing protein [Chloroflexota bacterium]
MSSDLQLIITCVTVITIMNIINQPKLIGIAHLNGKSQLVIPKEARRLLGIGPGDRVLIAAAPFLKGILITRPEDVEEHLQKMVSNTEKTIGVVRKELKK